MYGPSVGWCPGPRTGETEVDATKRNLASYPGTTVVRKFFSGSLGDWSSGALALLPPGCEVIVSIGTGHTTAPLRQFVEAMPAHVSRLVWVGRHEPEKKITPAGFTTEMQYYDRQVPRSHPLRASGKFIMGPMMTLQRARIFAVNDWAQFVNSTVAGVSDFLGWDVYPSDPNDYTATEPHWHKYESPEKLLDLIRQKSAKFNLPYGIGEFNHECVPGDTTGSGAADEFEGVYRAAKADGCLFIAQFAKGGGDWTAVNDVQHRTVYERWRGIIQEAYAARTAYVAGINVGKAEAGASITSAQHAMADQVIAFVNSLRS